ncbi:MAG TPA: Fic family protein, partial [Chitinophagales bacterium]|nr:Fic family protein [Chitinophagales bacterium]
YLPYYLRQQPCPLLKYMKKLQNIPLDLQKVFMGTAVNSLVIDGSISKPDDYYSVEVATNPDSEFHRQLHDLYNTYCFAQNLSIGWQNLMRIHKMLTQTLLQDSKQHRGKIRTDDVFICDENDVMIYNSVPATEVKHELKLLIEDIKTLTKATLTIDEVFYYAAMIHLRFAQIHPFRDGNGCTARLLEKIFLTQKLGTSAWCIQSEKYYLRHIGKYYRNIYLSESYDKLECNSCLPFLIMLPKALMYEK